MDFVHARHLRKTSSFHNVHELLLDDVSPPNFGGTSSPTFGGGKYASLSAEQNYVSVLFFCEIMSRHGT
jgi:hypothetical protein